MRICLITPGHLSTNPRLVKEADALAEAGHEVTVLAATYLAWGRETDQGFAERPWRRAPPVPFGPDAPIGPRVVQVIRQRAARALFAAGARTPTIADAAAHPAAPDIAATAARIPADLYIAHYIAALPAAAHAARVHGAAYAFDAEDFHTGETPDGVTGDNPMIAAVERAFLPGAAWLTADSPGVADAYAEAYGLARPVVLLNVFARDEAPAGPTARGAFEPWPSVYWFSQTLGPDRGLEAAVEAIARARSRPHLVLRGLPFRGYDAELQRLALQVGVADRLHFRPLAAPHEMARLAAEHDLGLAAENGHTLNHRICLGNKIFTYLLAGVPTLLSDVVAHRRLAGELGDAARLYRIDDPETLAAAMDAYLLDPERLAKARAEAFQLGQARFNWDVEKQTLLDLVTELGPRRHPSPLAPQSALLSGGDPLAAPPGHAPAARPASGAPSRSDRGARSITARGLFVSYERYLTDADGGVQVCTREYRQAIEAAGVELEMAPFRQDRRPTTRLLRQFDSSPYLRPADPAFIADLERRLKQSAPDFIFLNQVALAAMAGRLRAAAPASTRIVLLSHGMESTDLLHLIRARKRLPLSGRVRPFADVALGRVLRQEAATRAEVDGVLCLSAVDVVHERWVGAGRVDWLPRIVVPAPLPWKPEGRRLGWVGTLDHAPNLTGLVDVLEALARREDETVRIRVVGGPKRLGAWLAGRFRNVDYLGPLDRAALESEAQSWSAFLHPIFCWPRGCSTKLASALAWGLPIVTTPQGRRGYVWRQGSLIEAESPEAFLDAVERLFEPEIGRSAARDVALAAGSSPTLAEVAERLGGFLSDVAGTAP